MVPEDDGKYYTDFMFIFNKSIYKYLEWVVNIKCVCGKKETCAITSS